MPLLQILHGVSMSIENMGMIQQNFLWIRLSSFPSLQVARKLLGKKLGFRTNMNLIPLDASLVKGSHGTRTKDPSDWPIIMGHGIKPSEKMLPFSLLR